MKRETLVKRMTQRQTEYYMDRLTFLMAQSTLAAELNVSIMTIQRWQHHSSTPRYEYLPSFANLLKRELKSLSARATSPDKSYWRDVAECFTEDDPPPYEEPPTRLNPGALSDLLIEMCDPTAKSTDIFRITDEMGYTRMQVYHMASKLNIRRQHVKKGRNGYATWTLPPLPRKKRHA